MALHVGTSGWAYPEWRPAFYPAGLSRDRFLAHYSSALSACEINATHYQVEPEGVVAGWAAQTPEGFRFAAKAHRRLTHVRELPPARGGAAFMARFLESLAPLGARLGAILLQFPPTRARDEGALAALLELLPPGLPFALEFRHESWFVPGMEERAAAAGGTLCLSETAGELVPRLPDGPLAYVRLRGDRYSPETRQGWRDLLEREAVDRPVYAFAKHKDLPAGDPFGGVGLAEWLIARAGPVPG
jgi:uncharacterized protein YecE (DUF72 family)